MRPTLYAMKDTLCQEEQVQDVCHLEDGLTFLQLVKDVSMSQSLIFLKKIPQTFLLMFIQDILNVLYSIKKFRNFVLLFSI